MTASIRSSYASLSDLPTRYAGAADHWLSPAECQAWQNMRSAARRTTWLAGRIVAKRLLRERFAETNRHCLPPAPAEIHIESTGGQRPSIVISGRPLGWALSIAHTARGVLVATSIEPGVILGVDLVCSVGQSAERLAWCFTPAERRWLAEQPAHRRMPEQLWAMKEALYKACQQGEGFAPRQIEVVPGCDPDYRLLDATRAVRRVQGWRVDGHFAALAIAEPRHVEHDTTLAAQLPASVAEPTLLVY